MGLFKKIIDFIKKVSIPSFRFEDNKLYFKLKDDSFYEYDLVDYDVKTRHDPYVIEAYTLNNNDIFLEYIKKSSHVDSIGEISSLYEGFFKEKLSIKSSQILENITIASYTFKTLKIDNSFVLHMIHIFMGNTDVIIIDMKGNLYKNLLFRLDGKYIYEYKNEEKGSVNFNISLVKENCIRGFLGTRD